MKFTERRNLVRLGVVGLLFAGAFLLRVAATDPGPILVAPVLAAGWWFGRRIGAYAGVLGTVLFATSRALNSPSHGWSAVSATAIAAVAYAATGFGIGLLRDRERRLASTLARREVELEEVRSIQQALTPARAPKRPGLEISSCYVPAEAGVAGDFFLVTAGVTGDSTVIAVGDVAGKGIEAARRAALVRATLATAAMVIDDPSVLLERANLELVERQGPSSGFVTAACMTFHPESREVAWALAGHPAPLRLDTGVALDATEAGIPLGLSSEFVCEEGRLPLSPGDGIVAFTDGLTEARRHANGELLMLGEEPITRVVAGLPRVPPDRVVRELRRTAEQFTSGPLDDDLCIVAFRAEGAND